MRTIAQHYADALAEVAISQKSAGQVRRELRDPDFEVTEHCLVERRGVV